MTNLYVGRVKCVGRGVTGESNPKRPSELVIKKGDDIEKLAKSFGMSKEDFKAWAGITGSIKPGQKYTLPTIIVPKGKGLYSVYKDSGMTKAEFCKLNKIDDFDKYVCSEGEIFYVKRKQVPKVQNNNSQTEVPKKNNRTSGEPETLTISEKPDIASNTRKGGFGCSRVKSEEEIQQKLLENNIEKSKTPEELEILNKQWGSSYTPEELAKKIYLYADNYRGAVGTTDFDALINEINPKNVVEVLSAYSNLPENKDQRSLIKTITSETASTKEARKEVAMYIYDTLASLKTPPKRERKNFINELDKQFDKWIGRVDTEYLDILMGRTATRNWYISPFRTCKVQIPRPSVHPNKSINVSGSHFQNQTATSLRNDAINSSKDEIKQNFIAFCKSIGIEYDESLLDLKGLENIPYPVISEDNKIVPYVSDIMPPTTEPNGKVIILNSGHGGYNPLNGSFDAGASSFIRDKSGKYKPIREYEIMQNYTEQLAGKLREQGYAVVITQGTARAYSDTGVLSATIDKLQNGNMSDKKKYGKNDIAFVSLHADSSESIIDMNDKSGVCYNPKMTSSSTFAEVVNESMNSFDNTFLKSNLMTKEPGKNGVWVLTETSSKIPAILVETMKINGKNGRDNFLSRGSRDMIVDSILVGINKYFNVEDKTMVPKSMLKKEEVKPVIAPQRANYIIETGGGTHKVERGQTLDSISKIYGISIERIAQANGIDKNSILSIGQNLSIPPKRELTGVKNLNDVANVMGVSKDFLIQVKRLENGNNRRDDEFLNSPYPDVNGYSIGIGHYLGTSPDLNMKISNEKVCTYFAEDLLSCEDEIIGLLGRDTYAEIPKQIKEALLDMVFNKGCSIIDSKMVKDLKTQKYDDAICKMNYNKANTVKKGQVAEMSGLSKRRLFDISIAIGYYKKDIPQKIKDTAQQVYDRGVELLEAECAARKLSFDNILAGYNKDIKEYFGNRIKLIYK